MGSEPTKISQYMGSEPTEISQNMGDRGAVRPQGHVKEGSAFSLQAGCRRHNTLKMSVL